MRTLIRSIWVNNNISMHNGNFYWQSWIVFVFIISHICIALYHSESYHIVLYYNVNYHCIVWTLRHVEDISVWLPAGKPRVSCKPAVNVETWLKANKNWSVLLPRCMFGPLSTALDVSPFTTVTSFVNTRALLPPRSHTTTWALSVWRCYAAHIDSASWLLSAYILNIFHNDGGNSSPALFWQAVAFH